MVEFFDKALAERRSLEQVLSDLRDSYQRHPGPELAEKIHMLEVEISHRRMVRGATGPDQTE